MIPDSLKARTYRALSWSFVESIGLRGVQFVVGIVLARLLFPEQFGLIGMLTIFMSVAESLLDSGFGSALIQKRNVTPTDICSIFYFNIVVGLLATGLICIVTPWISAFYNQPILIPLTRVLSLTIIINSFGMIQNIMFIKQINFKILTKVSIIASVMSGIIGVTLAAFGFGVWSLVIQQISSAFFRTVSLWFFSPWRPALIFSFSALREMFGFGSRMLFSGLLNQIFDNIYLLVIGKLFSATDLGFFTRAKTFQELPSQTLSGMVGRVTFPVFSIIQDDPMRLKMGMKKALTILSLINFPMMVGLTVIARPLVLVLLTEKWAECIVYLQLFCLVGLLFPMHLINLNILQAVGRSDLFLRLEIIKKVLIALNIFVTWRWGIYAMISGMIVTSIISSYLNSYYTGLLIGYPLREQLHDVFSYFIMAVMMGMVVMVVSKAGLLTFHNQWYILLAKITVGIIIYVCLCRLFRLAAFMDIWQVVWNRLPSLRRSETSG